MSAVFSYHPRSHGTLILYHSCLQRVFQLTTQLPCQFEQQWLIDEVTLGSIWQMEAASCYALDLVLDSNRRCEAAEKKAAWFQDPPSAVQHGMEVIVAAGEMEHRAADHKVGKAVWKGHCFDRFLAKVGGWKCRCDSGDRKSV